MAVEFYFFLANGEYVRQWVPELADMPDKFLHKPWEAPESVLKDAGVTLDDTYTSPLIGLKEGRERALEAYKAVKKD